MFNIYMPQDTLKDVAKCLFYYGEEFAIRSSWTTEGGEGTLNSTSEAKTSYVYMMDELLFPYE